MPKDHNTVTPMRLEPAAPLSQVKHTTTEPLRTYFVAMVACSFYGLEPFEQFLKTAYYREHQCEIILKLDQQKMLFKDCS